MKGHDEGPPDKENNSTSLEDSKMLEQKERYKRLLETRRKMFMSRPVKKKNPSSVEDLMNSIERKPDSPNKKRLNDMVSQDTEKYMKVARLFREMGDVKAVREKLLNEKLKIPVDVFTEKGSNKEFPGQFEDPPDMENILTSLEDSEMLEQKERYRRLLETRRKMRMSCSVKMENPPRVEDLMNSIIRKPDSPNKESFNDMVNRDTEKYMKVARLFREMGDAKALREKLLKEKLKISSDVFTEKSSNKEFPELTPKMKAAITALLQKVIGDDFDVITSYDDIPLLRKDFRTLNHESWLNDGITNCYLKLLMERSKLDNYPSMYCFSSSFYGSLLRNPTSRSIERWTMKEDIFSYDLLCFPLNLESIHWGLCVVDNRDKTVKFYDSMAESRDEHLTVHIRTTLTNPSEPGETSAILPINQVFRNYLIAEMQNKKGMIMPTDEYTCIDVENLPQQENGFDCGMFTLMYAEYITRDAPITFNQENIPYFRRRMVWELRKHKLM